MKTQTGFTLIELMVTVALLAVVVTIGLPNLTDFVRNNRITTTANDLVAAITIARSEAVKRRTSVTLCPSNNSTSTAPDCATGAGAEWANGWVVFEDTDGDAVIDTGEALLQQHEALGNRISINADASISEYISFGRNGLTRTTGGGTLTGNLVICDDRGLITYGGGDIAIARALVLSRTGRPQVLKYQSQINATSISCP